MDVDVIEENLRLVERIIDIGRDDLGAWPLTNEGSIFFHAAVSFSPRRPKRVLQEPWTYAKALKQLAWGPQPPA